MCMKCEIKNALKGALANAAGLKITEEVIGKATEAQLKELQAADEAEKAIKKQLQAEYKAEIAPIREKYLKRTEELLKPVFERHDEVCVEIQKDLGVTDDDEVSIDLGTGEVTKEVIKEKETSNLH
ncbi:hypothetical protein ACQVQT_00475 [Bacillus paranthracis]|uniref:Uncharacterized protein n=1 Tax=Bacillus paranthracis TaxID=2026186 RepID=A0A5M9H7F0_9BACI|nr:MULTISPECIES: hypothetical protein [Bacillus cereus group]EJR17237.1 hypothetical protein II7_01421 [Bacillus cereus MSX-A12]KXI40968.1 hypothetical protein ACS53_12250 [Bacillus cereus]MBQ6447802.1 hypothetical protein [Bacillus sp. (in: firmicutes)]KAA8481207.1 hypothetical protein FYW06_05220 [Bacillus paranthracis]KXI58366.1 hypothetical protein ACS48_17615 [Bacillus cereus]